MAASARIRAVAAEGGGGETSSDTRDRRRRRRPLHLACTSGLLLWASAPLASADRLRRPRTANSQRRDHRRKEIAERDSHRRRRRLAKKTKSKLCPPSHTGPVPTAHCAGYVSCADGVQTSAVQSCAGGTQFHLASQGCTWPSAVEEGGGCKWGEALFDDKGLLSDASDASGGGQTFCPDGYTGRAPTSNCAGYVDCRDGVDGLSANCPPATLFASATGLCEYGLDVYVDCQMLRGPSPGDFPDPDNYGNELDGYCPDDYTGRAPAFACDGYVDCRGGAARRSKMCPEGTKFDAMTMACSYHADIVCEAAEYAGPTPAPVSLKDARLEAYITGCPAGYTGNQILPGCTSYLYCQSGVELNRFDCGAGTYFDGQLCVWQPEHWKCDATAIPTLAPSESPTPGPTPSPTETPTEFDWDGPIYYPDFGAGVCLNDGGYPEGVGTQYLKRSSWACCREYFPTNMAACQAASVPTPAPSPSVGPEFYPLYSESRCASRIRDGEPGEWETNFFATYEDCCAFDWISDPIECLRQKPVVLWYPDYERNVCRNDGGQSPFEMNLYETMEGCCGMPWIEYEVCMAGGTAEEEDGASDDGGAVPGAKFYPDQSLNVCHCDGKQSIYEADLLYDTYDDCCDFPLVDTNICKQYKALQQGKCVVQADGGPSGPKAPSKPNAPSPSAPTRPRPPTSGGALYYPDEQLDLCRSDGVRKPDGGVLLTTSTRECCRRFFPADKRECRSRSEGLADGTWVPPPDAGQQDQHSCAGKKPGQCNRDPKCAYNADWEMCEYKAWDDADEAPPPTPAPQAPPPQRCSTEATGFYPLHGCAQYVYCAAGTALHTYDCPEGTKYDGTICNHAHKVMCSDAITLDGEGGASAPSPPGDAQGPPPAPKPAGRPIQQQLGRPIQRPQSDSAEAPCESYRTKKQCNRHSAGSCRYDDVWKVCYSAAGGSPAMVQPASESRTDAVAEPRPFYPDYFYNVCRNDGNQPATETSLFDTREACCRDVEYLDADACLSNAGG